MTLRERQDLLIENLSFFDTWPERFNYFISESEFQLQECPANILAYKMEGCQSRTYFKTEVVEKHIRIGTWSNSSVMAGILVTIQKIFNCTPVEELAHSAIDFHEKTDLINNLTPMRKAVLLEIIKQLTVLSSRK